MTTGEQDQPLQIDASATVRGISRKRKPRSRRTNKADGDDLSTQTDLACHTDETDTFKKRSCGNSVSASVDITSPLGQKLSKKSKKPPLNTLNLVRCYEKYCNWGAEDMGNRRLRSQTDYCADHWNLDNIHYVRLPGHVNINRPYTFGKRGRRRRYKTINSGLNSRSRRLLPLVKSCSIVLDRSTDYDVEPCDDFGSLLESPDWKVDSTKCNSDDKKEVVPVNNENIPAKPQNVVCSVPASLLTSRAETGTTDIPVSEKMPGKCSVVQGAIKEDERAFIKWEELVGDAPKRETHPELVDLTFESDDDMGSGSVGGDGDSPPSPTPRRQLADVEQILGSLCDGPIVPTKPLPAMKRGHKRTKMNTPKRNTPSAMSKTAFFTWY